MHKCIGLLLSFGRQSVGTAFLISRDILVTAAHTICKRESRLVSTDTKFYPGVNGELDDYPCYNIQTIFIPEEFYNSKASNPLYDFAFLKL